MGASALSSEFEHHDASPILGSTTRLPYTDGC
jgi:hypothetical protein